ncbi:MAG: nickel pincer cofactor biosynthesis protein LarC [Nitrosopumilaceae archaeon]|nr:nickel pincer cofactor biosynthesis protein LarC [Nitrosopumilaceae archaeon]
MVIVIDPHIAGISGDMILSSLVDMGANKNKIIQAITSSEKFLDGSTIKKIDFLKIKKHGIQCTSLKLEFEENTDERKGLEIKKAILNSLKNLTISDKGKKFAESCIDTLISCESKIHGVPIDSVHFHEASSIDTLVDIIGVAIAADDLNLFDEEILSMPVCVGGGVVSFSHGTMTNPASAILEIFKKSSLEICGSNAKSELTTPTGACILVNLSNTPIEYYPAMKIKEVGYGSGQKDFDDFANVLKIVRGIKKTDFVEDSVIVLETNIDDVSGEILGNLIEKLMSVGAKDAFISHGIAKKGRPSNLISVLCDDDTLDQIVHTLFTETGTLGIRIARSNRMIIPRKIKEIKIDIDGNKFSVKYKISTINKKSNFKVEFEDLKEISGILNKPIKDTELLIRKEITKEEENLE